MSDDNKAVRHAPLLHNVITNYVGQIYVVAIGIVMIPVYIHYIGIEAYGVIGFLAALQAWMGLLDFGLAPTLGREAAKCNAGVTSASSLYQFIAFLERFFLAIGVVLVIVSSLSGKWIATNWLKLDSLNIDQVAICIPMAGLMISMRLGASAYRSALQGLERQLQANVLAVVFATIRSVFVIAILAWVSSSILALLAYQLVISAIELAYLRRALFLSLPAIESSRFFNGTASIPFDFLRGMACLYWIGVAFSQSDKLLLSHILGMKEYGHFILAATIAMGLNLIAMPMQQAVLPRMTMLAELGRSDQLISLYRQTTRFMLAMLAGIACVFIAFPAQSLFVWTGNVALSTQSADVLRWYAAGTALMSLSGMPYLLQQAYGRLDLHIKASVLSLLIFIPTVILSTLHYGATGAAKAWMWLNFLSILILSPIVHYRFAKAITFDWLIKDIFPTMILVAGFSLLANNFTWNPGSRWSSGAMLALVGSLFSCIVLFGFKDTRRISWNMIRKIAHI